MGMKKKVYQRVCKRCGKVFEYSTRYGKICGMCKLPTGIKGAKLKKEWEEKKRKGEEKNEMYIDIFKRVMYAVILLVVGGWIIHTMLCRFWGVCLL